MFLPSDSLPGLAEPLPLGEPLSEFPVSSSFSDSSSLPERLETSSRNCRKILYYFSKILVFLMAKRHKFFDILFVCYFFNFNYLLLYFRESGAFDHRAYIALFVYLVIFVIFAFLVFLEFSLIF